MRPHSPPTLEANLARASPRRKALTAAVLLCAFALAASSASGAPVDSIAQRVLACTGCHDDLGRVGKDAYYPRIAGKPEGYLFNQLVNFREGRRFYALMNYLIDQLPDSYLREIAAHFAAQSPPYPEPARTSITPAVLERGRALVVTGDPARKLPGCTDCHGASLMGVAPTIPGLLALPREYLTAQLAGWRAGTRRALAPDCMAEIASRLSNEDVAAIVAWLAAQPVAKGAKPEPATPAKLPIECGSVPAPGSARAQ